MSSFYLLLLLLPTFFFLRIHCSPILQAAINLNPKAYYNCTRNSTFAPNSSYHSNVKTLLDWLSSNGTGHTGSYNTTVVSNNASDTVYGLFICYKDAPLETSKHSLLEASKLLLSLCTTAKEAIIWINVCYVRYSDRNFFSTVEESPKLTAMNDHDYVGDVGRFNSIVWDMLNNMRSKAAYDTNKLAIMAVNITADQMVYGSAWCLPYLSTEDCKWCLGDAIAEVQTVCIMLGRNLYKVLIFVQVKENRRN